MRAANVIFWSIASTKSPWVSNDINSTTLCLHRSNVESYTLHQKASPSDITMTWRKGKADVLVCHTWFSLYGSVFNKTLTDMYTFARGRINKHNKQCMIFGIRYHRFTTEKPFFQACLCIGWHVGLLQSWNLMVVNDGSFFLTSSNHFRCQMIPPQIMHFIVVQGIEICYLGNQLHHTMLVFVNWLIEWYMERYMSDPRWLLT